MHSPTLTPAIRNAILLALGFTASTLATAGGCAARGIHELCADSEVDYATCTQQPEPLDPDAPYVHVEEVCFDGSQGCDPCDVEAITGAAIDHADNSCEIIALQRVTLACGPDPESTDCCYKVMLEGDLSCAVTGRPLRVGAERRARVAELRVGAAEPADAHAFAQLRRPAAGELLERLREHWLSSARYEHASVAAFAKLGLQLLSLGAPATLLRATQEAMADEVRHAQLCLRVAAGYGAATCEIGPLRIDGCVSTGMELEALLREAIIEGALGEGAAALEALEGARACSDPIVRGVLARIAADEQRHALLAYQTLRWALVAEPERARTVVLECLRAGRLHAPRPATVPTTAPADDAACAHGLLSSERRAWLRHEVWHELVVPILTVMLQTSHASARA